MCVGVIALRVTVANVVDADDEVVTLVVNSEGDVDVAVVNVVLDVVVNVVVAWACANDSACTQL